MQSINVENESYYQNKLDKAQTLAKKGTGIFFLCESDMRARLNPVKHQ